MKLPSSESVLADGRLAPVDKLQPRWSGQRLIYVRDLLLTLVGRELKLRYKRSFLGIAWSLLTPLAQFAVFYLTFDVLLPLNIPNYPAFIFSGILVWNWFQGSLYQVTSTIVDNRDLIKRPGFPPAVLPVVTVASYLIHFLLALPILVVFLMIGKLHFTAALWALPLVIATQFIFTLSLAYLTATLYVHFRDIQHLLGVVLNLLFFLSPVFYKASDLPAQYQIYYQLNPMVPLIEGYRAILLAGVWPNGWNLSVLAAITMAILGLSYRIFMSASGRFVDEL